MKWKWNEKFICAVQCACRMTLESKAKREKEETKKAPINLSLLTDIFMLVLSENTHKLHEQSSSSPRAFTMFDGLIVILEMFYYQPFFHRAKTTQKRWRRRKQKKNRHIKIKWNEKKVRNKSKTFFFFFSKKLHLKWIFGVRQLFWRKRKKLKERNENHIFNTLINNN